MPEMGGLELIREMKIRNPDIKALILTIYDHENYVIASFREGVSGYLLKDDHADELLFSIQHIKIGGKYLSSALAIRMLDQRCQEEVGFN
jgi:DNA-binding NarL/FixJ family response regulator